MLPDVIFMIGPSGAGKGTQSRVLSERYGYFHWDMGSILREMRDEPLPFDKEGRTIGKFITAGNFLADDQLYEIISERLERLPVDQRIIFDGVPRRLGQAEYLVGHLREKGRTHFATVYLNISADETHRRLSVRREAEGRTDDHPEAIELRLRQFEEATRPVLDYLRKEGAFVEIDGHPSIPEVTTEIITKALDLK